MLKSIDSIDIKLDSACARELPLQVRQQIVAALNEIRLGAVEIVIHDGKILQIERKEKIRFS